MIDDRPRVCANISARAKTPGIMAAFSYTENDVTIYENQDCPPQKQLDKFRRARELGCDEDEHYFGLRW